MELITEFNVVDRRSYSFRYPMTKDATPSQNVDFGFNVFRFARLLDPVITGLIDLCDYLDGLRWKYSR